MKDLYFKVVAILIAIFMGISRVNAQAKISYVGENKVNVGDTFTLKVKVSDIEELPIIGIGGNLVFNNEYLELIKMEGMEEPFPMRFNEKYYIFSGFSMEAKGIAKEADILTLTFKALKEGSTNLAFREAELSDYNADIVGVLEVPYLLTITEKKESNFEEVQKDTSKDKITNEVKEEVSIKDVVKEENEVKENIPVIDKTTEIENTKSVNLEKNKDSDKEIKSTTLETSKDKKETSLQSINKLFEHFKSFTLNKRNVTNSQEKTPIYITIKNVIKNLFKN
ncbi:MAG: cohesin domain-containing protein [Ruminococcus sp.]|nr:cohesin domain-containing protein [Ruminococcus sp.]